MKHLCVSLVSLLTFLFLGSSSAFAAVKDEISFGVMELNKTYNMTGSNYYYGTFTPEKDGYLQVYSNRTTNIRTFKSWEGSASATMALQDNEYSHYIIVRKDVYSYSYELPVKKGTTYYMCGNTMMGDNIDVVLKMEPKTIEFFECSLEEGDEVSPTSTNSVSFGFNREVRATSAAIVYGDGKQEGLTPTSNDYNASISVSLKDALLKLGTAGVIKKGDVITVVVKGVKENPENLGDGEQSIVYGDASVKLTVGDMPTMLLSTTMDGVPVTANTKFMTYYAPGTGKLVLTFSKELDSDYGEAIIRFGDFDQADNGGYYQEENDEKEGNFTMQVKGNQVILDFSGKRRAVTDMVSSTESMRGVDFSVINLQISKITDVDGVKAFSTSSTTMGRFNYSFTLDVPEANVSSEFTPASGASIKNQKNIEIWITDYETLAFQGISFSYNQKENGIEPEPDADGNVDIIKDVVVDMKDVQVEKDPDDEDGLGAYILTVPVPEEVKNMNNVTVSLYKVTCADGKDYTDIVAAKYNVVASGVDNITVATDKDMKVYNLNGQLVREGKSLNGLKGVYIINGKKVVLN